MTQHQSLHTCKEPHSNEQEYRSFCNVCDKGFRSQGQMIKHFRIHTGLPHKCNTCDESFRLQKQLTQHHQSKHGHVCPTCGKIFKAKASLTVHEKIHSTDPAVVFKHKCPHCPKAFRIDTHWRRHLRSHSEVRDYTCKVCDKQFKDSYILKIHERRHTG